MPYARYRDTPDGISPLAFPGTKEAIVKANSYAHDEDGITTEEAPVVLQMTHKRMRKEASLISGLDRYHPVNLLGVPDAPTALLCWGSTRGACVEAACRLGLRVVQPVVLSPFPERQVKEALAGVKRLIVVEENATGQLAAVARQYGIPSDARVLKIDGRSFTPDELYERIQEVMQK
jgi:2-oxoglutarate/2-oxoacid ferredoxin oxidoreductase subunit alpha